MENKTIKLEPIIENKESYVLTICFINGIKKELLITKNTGFKVEENLQKSNSQAILNIKTEAETLYIVMENVTELHIISKKIFDQRKKVLEDKIKNTMKKDNSKGIIIPEKM